MPDTAHELIEYLEDCVDKYLYFAICAEDGKTLLEYIRSLQRSLDSVNIGSLTNQGGHRED